MGAAPSRESIRRSFLSVNQTGAPAGGAGGGAPGGGTNKRQDIILIPLTKEYFPSPDCPLFVQFHKARCDAAVNYYFRRPGNPGDLSCIPNYARSYRLPGEETRSQHRRRRQREREARAAATSSASGVMREACHATSSDEEDDDEDDMDVDDDDEDDSYPSREALYRGVIEHVEEALFDTDAEMRQAFEWAMTHPHTTMGPDGKKQRKVLPVLCAVAFRSDISKSHGWSSGSTTAGGSMARPSASLRNNTAPSPSTVSTSVSPHLGRSSASIAMNNMQAALENGVYMFGSIINIVGCFGFVSMEEDVEDAQRMSTQASVVPHPGGPPGSTTPITSPNLLTPGALRPATASNGGAYHHDPYSFSSSQASSGSFKRTSSMTSTGTLLSTRGGGRRGSCYLARVGAPYRVMTLPPPVAAPLAAMVFLTKSAGEQNLGRVSHIAATTYYFQMIQAGVIDRQPEARMEGPAGYPNITVGAGIGVGSASQPPLTTPAHARGSSLPSSAATATSSGVPAPPPSQAPGPPRRPFLPPMETFSFSSLLTNIPILSFLYEMKWRWGYLGVLKAETPTAGAASHNSSFNGCGTNERLPCAGDGDGGSGGTARGPGSMMGNHSSGGLAAVDRSVGQGVTDEMEMWITADQMIHGRISKDLAQRLCWSLAERPEVMQEHVTQLPSEETGYWRYRGLVDQAHPPPIPEPGRVVTIHPKDVYVMGSDVLPGFNEGDILRFDLDRLVWCADHSIPLEGVVLAAMRPYCKEAREADPDDAAWVTRVCDADDAEALQNGENDVCYPRPPVTEEQLALMRSDPSLVHIHEHVGNFYVYRFERDGTTYYHGTVPNFANPNKRKRAPLNSFDGATAGAQTGPVGALPLSSATSSLTAVPPATESATPSRKPSAPPPSPLLSALSPVTSASKRSLAASLPAPRTIASALFSLLPASLATVSNDRPSGTHGGGVAENGAGEHGRPSSSQASTAAVPGSRAVTSASSLAGRTTDGATIKPTWYLATPVTSTSTEAMNRARRWMQTLYSYAYGVPNLPPTRGNAISHAATATSSSLRPALSTNVFCSVAANGGAGGRSHPATPAHPSLNSTPVSVGLSVGFPMGAAVDGAVWPSPKHIFSQPTTLLSPTSPTSPPQAGAAAANVNPPPLILHRGGSSCSNGSDVHPNVPHVRSGSHTLPLQASDSAVAEVTPVTPTVAHVKPIRRCVEGGGYEWDWRKL